MKMNECYHDLIKAYKGKTKASGKAYGTASQYLAGGETRSVSYYDPYPLNIIYGSGCRIYDEDKNPYYDCINNYTSLIHGHAHPEITEAIAKAAEKGTAVVAGMSEQVDLARLLCGRVPCVERIRFCNSGTEAVLFAVRAAKAYTGRPCIVKILGGYHGTTDMMEYNVSPEVDREHPEKMCIAKPDIRGVSEKIADEILIIPFNDMERAEEVFKQHGDSVAAVITEPFLGAGGMIPARKEYLEKLRELTEKHGAVLIFDEVQSLRLSEGGGQKCYQVIPDLSAFGKIIGGGLAVGAFGGKKEIMELFSPAVSGYLSQSGTFNGNRVTMAAGFRTLSLYNQRACDRLEELAVRLEGHIRKAFMTAQTDGCVTRAGSLMNYHFMKEEPEDYASGAKDDKELFKIMHLEMLMRGVFLAPRGMIALSTPMTEPVIDEIGMKFEESLLHMKGYM
ncbi:aspartate aminotransferase family protein [Lachnospiraceae bacterium 54-53]